MKKFEFIAGLVVVIATVLKLIHIRGGGAILVLSFSTLSMFYYFSFAFFNNIRFRDIFKREAYKDTNPKRIIGAIGLGYGLAVIIMGALFKFQLWTGWSTLLTIGLVVIGVVLIVALIFYFRNKSKFYLKIFKRIAIIGGLGFILFLTPSSTLVDIYYRDNPEYAELYKKVLADPDNIEGGSINTFLLRNKDNE